MMDNISLKKDNNISLAHSTVQNRLQQVAWCVSQTNS